MDSVVGNQTDVLQLLGDGTFVLEPASLALTSGSSVARRLLADGWIERLVTDDRERVCDALRGIEPGSPVDVECKLLQGEREVVYIELRAARVGETLVGVVRDVSARRRAEDGLRQSNEMLNAIILSSPIAIVSLDFDGMVKSWNPAAEKVFGWTEDEVLGKTNPIVPKARWPEFKAYFDRVLDGAALSRVEVRRERKDGQFIDLSVTTAPLHNARGDVSGMIGVLADITERKRAGEQKETVSIISQLFLTLDSLEEIYRALPAILSARFQFPIVAITLLDEARDVLTVVGSVGLEKPPEHAVPVRGSLSGVSVMSGQPLVDSDVSHRPEYQSSGLAVLGVRTFLCVPMKMGERVRGCLTLSDTRIMELQPSLVDTVQVIANYLATAIERKEAVEEIKQLNLSLERRVQERTAELQEANKELESFSYSVSHDLRAPLRAIDGFSRILLEDHAETLDADGQRVLNVIINNARKMSQLIDDLLAFSRLGRKSIEGHVVDMGELARSVFEELVHANPQRVLTLTVGEALPQAWGDASMIRQVFVNLLSNAVKFTAKKPEPYIDLGARMEDGQALYWVKDNGAGFDMQYASKLFGVFQRLHKPTDYEGTGVGLAIVHRIVSRHGGRVWAEAQVNAGATFFFTLPVSAPA